MTTPKIGRPLTPTRNTSPREMSRLSWSFWSVPSSLTSKKNSSQDPSFRYESTSQPKHDGVWTTFTINRYLFHIVRSLQGYQGPGIYLHFSSGREQFPGFYAQFRELNKAIGASGDGHLEYVYDNLMITEVPTFLFRDDFSVERCSPGKCKTQGGWHLCQHQHKMLEGRKGDVGPPCQCPP